MNKHNNPDGTARQEWMELLNDTQKDVNETLRNLQLDIEMGNVTIAELYTSKSDEWMDLASELVEYLDKEWGYSDDRFMVIGKLLEPTIGIDKDGILAPLEEKQAFRSAISKGFDLYLPDESDSSPPRIVMSFAIAKIPVRTPSLSGNLEVYAYADPANISLQYMRPRGSEVMSPEGDEITRGIRQADALLKLYTTHENSTFYREEAKKQHAFLDSITNMANDTLPLPNSLDHAILDNARPSHVHIYGTDKQLVTVRGHDDKDQSLLITGEIIGTTLIEGIINADRDPAKPYRNVDELDVAISGLMLLVKPRITNIQIPGFDYEDILVPARALDSLPLKLV